MYHGDRNDRNDSIISSNCVNHYPARVSESLKITENANFIYEEHIKGKKTVQDDTVNVRGLKQRKKEYIIMQEHILFSKNKLLVRIVKSER